jgi:hypothetical protein
MFHRLVLLALFVLPAAAAQSGPAAPQKPLTNSDIVSMVQAGLDESTVVLAIDKRSNQFDTSPEALIALKNTGIPKNVIEAMLRRSNQAQPPPPTVAATPAEPAKIVSEPEPLELVQAPDGGPPLPKKLLTATTAYLSVDTDWSEGHAKAAYGELQKWGRLRVVANEEDADVVLVITTKDAGTFGISTGSAVAYGSGNTAYATGTGVVIPLQLHTLHLYAFDRDHHMLFSATVSDQWLKSTEAKKLIKKLRKRIEGK